MPEFRQNLATKEWVIIATERAQRPHDLKSSEAPGPSDAAGCPFCPGNEAMSPEQSHVLAEGGSWRVRAIRNKFPVLVPDDKAKGERHPLYRSLPGEGGHEVIIESPEHDTHLALMPEAQVRDVFTAYQQRFNTVNSAGKVALTLIFKNHGSAAGTSLHHPHSQLVGSPVVPSNIRHRMDEAEKYYESTGTCVFCRMVQQETKDGARMVGETDHFAAFVLYAALSPFHMWVLPKRHIPSFGDTNAKELADLARVMQRVLRRFHAGLNNPAYNFVIQSTPLDRGSTDAFHWYISVVLRLSRTAGFELGSGMYVNTVLPEESARFLQSVKI